MAAPSAILRSQVRKTLLKVKSLSDIKIALVSSVARDISGITKNVPQSEINSNGNIQYPPIKPKFPPGKWGDMDPTYAWLWQQTMDDLRDISDVRGRQEYIIRNEMSHINLIPYYDHPNYLEFATYATKTALHPWSESTPCGTESTNTIIDGGVIQTMKNIIIDQILIEHEVVERESVNTGGISFNKRQASIVLRNIFETLMTHLNGNANHLRTCQYDENVIVRAVWDRHGITRKRMHRLGPTAFKLDDVSDQRVSSSCIFDGMIRSHFPLPEVHPRESGPSIESEKPVLKYKTSCYGVTKQPSFKPKSILAGHTLGDPCEYGTVGLLLTHRKEKMDSDFGPKIAKECRLGRGLSSTFTWLAAQAYNQGFSGFIDLTYPLTSQTVMSDGRNFSFIRCQLNTLELWKSDIANEIVNLCWHSDEMPLYECIENGEVKGFNDDVLKMLVDVFLLEPVDRGYDMKPTISEKDFDLHQKRDFIPGKVEEVVEEEKEQYIV